MNETLTELGLNTFFTQQLSLEEFESGRLARVSAVHRSGIVVNDGTTELSVALNSAWFELAPEDRPTVGDWVNLDDSGTRLLRLLERRSIFKRVAAGEKVGLQLIAANIDTLFIVTSCNEDFNESRLERYLALAHEAGVDPVIVLSKADLSDDPDVYRDRASSLQPGLPVEVVNALDEDSLNGLRSWISTGTTIAVVGSSGVGKSTLVNALAGQVLMETAAIREQDAKGRHTTTHRALHRLPTGGLILDVPGMRELKLGPLEDALSEVFKDIESLASQCRYRDCQHEEEPGCAIRVAIDDGRLTSRRLSNYRKLVREEAHHAATIAEQRHRQKEFGKTIKQHLDHKKRTRGG